MIQVRCPGCGYLQTLSEERFLAVTEDFLNCPHCRQKVPKIWTPGNSESMPDEVKHKMLAFSRRILNGGEITREIVHALESQVRHFGAIPESIKALGMGYSYLGDYGKAEEFLVKAGQEEPRDPEVLHCLLEMFVDQKNFFDAVQIGEELVFKSGFRASDEDVANLAQAYCNVDKAQEARDLLDNYPELDKSNAAIKMVYRRLTKINKKGLTDLLKQNSAISRILKRTGAEEKRSPAEEHAVQEALPAAGHETGLHEPEGITRLVNPAFEYWVYTLDSTIPKWDDIRTHLMRQHSDKAERERMFRFLESAIQVNQLAIDYMQRTQENDLFNYPEESIPHNSRNLCPDDRNKLLNAAMIVRVRYKPEGNLVLHNLFFVPKLDRVHQRSQRRSRPRCGFPPPVGNRGMEELHVRAQRQIHRGPCPV